VRPRFGEVSQKTATPSFSQQKFLQILHPVAYIGIIFIIGQFTTSKDIQLKFF